METKKEKTEIIKEQEQINLLPLVKFITTSSIKVAKVKRTENYTIITFCHFAGKKYVNGGWVTISPNTYIRKSGTAEKLVLVKAEGIPLSPQKHFYKSTHEYLFYTLYFPPLLHETASIDIIEKEAGDSSYFNFYGVALSRIKEGAIKINGFILNINHN